VTVFEALDIVGHFAFAASLIGMLLIGRSRRPQARPGLEALGWPLRLGGEAAWVAIGIVLVFEGVPLSSLVIWGLIFCAVDIYGWSLSLQLREGKR